MGWLATTDGVERKRTRSKPVVGLGGRIIGVPGVFRPFFSVAVSLRILRMRAMAARPDQSVQPSSVRLPLPHALPPPHLATCSSNPKPPDSL